MQTFTRYTDNACRSTEYTAAVLVPGAPSTAKYVIAIYSLYALCTPVDRDRDGYHYYDIARLKLRPAHLHNHVAAVCCAQTSIVHKINILYVVKRTKFGRQ